MLEMELNLNILQLIFLVYNWTMKEQWTVCLYRHVSGDLFSRISLSREIKLLAKTNWCTVYDNHITRQIEMKLE